MNDESEEKTRRSGDARSPWGSDGPLIQPKKQSVFSSLWSSFLAGVVVVAQFLCVGLGGRGGGVLR